MSVIVCLAVLQYFNEMDDMYERACEMESAMEAAVNAENYEVAGQYKQEYEDIRRQDIVDTLLQVCHGPTVLCNVYPSSPQA